METPRNIPQEVTIEASIPRSLPARARNNIRWAIREGRLENPDALRLMTDDQIKTHVRSTGRTQGIGQKTLIAIREHFPISLSLER